MAKVSVGWWIGRVLAIAIMLAPVPAGVAGDQGRGLWSLRPLSSPPVPCLDNGSTGYSPIDAFIGRALRSAGIRALGEADRLTLVRRLHFDLLGLPPDPEAARAFAEDPRPDAYERLVDRLLASPRFGERFGRHWLDVVRYADSDGFKTDALRPLAYRYRDWVIRAFNENMPYDEFVRLQIAGDEIAPYDLDAVAATTFLRHWPFEDNQRDLVRRRQDILNDITDATAVAFLGLTLKCARCHDHKFDPLTQEDYYRFQAFFAGIEPAERPVGTPDQLDAYRRAYERWREKTEGIRREMAELERPYREAHFRDARAKFPPDVQAAIDTPPEQRTPVQRQLYTLAANQLHATTEQIVGRMKKEDRERWEELNAALEEYRSLLPPELAKVMTVREVTPEPPKTFILARGVARSPVREVSPGFPACLGGGTPDIRPVRRGEFSSPGRRLALAKWLTDPSNPLPARVFANRLWLYVFGEGIVATPGDFGTRGAPPTHPELLDWLASRLIASDWDTKRLVREMVVSATYRRASTARRQTAAFAANRSADPRNTRYWRANRKRLEGEIIRDAMLAVAGELDYTMYGPAVRPTLPADLESKYAWQPDPESKQRRRSVYLLVRRNLRYPLFEVFDFPDANEPCTRRAVTITPPQAHMMLNSAFARRAAAAFARRLFRECGADREALVNRSFWLAFGRPPSREELAAACRFLSDQAERIRGELGTGARVRLPSGPLPGGLDPATAAAVEDFCLALYNANEFVFVD